MGSGELVAFLVPIYYVLMHSKLKYRINCSIAQGEALGFSRALQTKLILQTSKNLILSPVLLMNYQMALLNRSLTQ